MDTSQELILAALFLGTNALSALGFYLCGHFHGYEKGVDAALTELNDRE